MTAVATDTLATAIKSLIATLTQAPCYDHDELQALTTKPAQCTVIYLSRRQGGNVRGDTVDDTLRRLQVRSVAKTVGNVRLLEDRVAAGFENTMHTVAGVTVHFAFETADAAPEFDMATSRYQSLSDWTFAV